MKKIVCLSIIYLMLFLNKALGCSCKAPNEIKTKYDLERYDFVALVKVEKVIDSTRAHLTNATVLELFKGEYIKQKISFWGRGTECEMGPMKGETWIVFGNYKGYFIETNTCSHSTRYTESEDQTDKTSKLLYTLRSLYNPLPNKKQISNFWDMIQYSSNSIYIDLKTFFYQAVAFCKSIFLAS